MSIGGTMDTIRIEEVVYRYYPHAGPLYVTPANKIYRIKAHEAEQAVDLKVGASAETTCEFYGASMLQPLTD